MAQLAPQPAPRRALRVHLWVPLIVFVVPNVVIGYGFVLPRHGAGGLNELSIGFAATLVAAVATYVTGVRAALRT
jgi:hypothetical protein